MRLAAPIALSCAYIASSLFQFSVLRYVVFRVTHRPMFVQANAYVITAIASWWAILGAVTLLTYFFPLTTMESRIVSIPVLFPLNYLISRYYIFRK